MSGGMDSTTTAAIAQSRGFDVHALTFRYGQAGMASALSWLLFFVILVVTLKYVVILLRADNNGEGGTLSLTALVFRALDQSIKKVDSIVKEVNEAKRLAENLSQVRKRSSVNQSIEQSVYPTSN